MAGLFRLLCWKSGHSGGEAATETEAVSCSFDYLNLNESEDISVFIIAYSNRTTITLTTKKNV